MFIYFLLIVSRSIETFNRADM